MAEERTLTKEVNFTTVPHVGGGDADVFSQDGRTTEITVRTSDLNNHSTHLTITVVYRIQEVSPDHTVLERREEQRLDAPDGFRIARIGMGRMHANFRDGFPGGDHGVHEISSRNGIQGSYLNDAHVKFDDWGRDDLGNAQFRGHLSIPVVLENSA